MTTLAVPLRFLRGSIGAFLLTVLAVASGVALVCAIDLANRAVSVAFAKVIDEMAGRTSLQVTAGSGAWIPEETAEKVAAVDGVSLAVPVVNSWAYLTDGSGEQLVVHGVDLTNDDAIRVYEPAGKDAVDLEDSISFLNRRDSVILTQAFATRRGLTVDDTIELETPKGRQRFTIRALLAASGIARTQGGNLLIMDIAAAEAAFTARGLVNRVDVVVTADREVQSVRNALVAQLPVGFRVQTPEHRRVDLNRVIRSVQVLLRAVSCLGLVAAFLIAFSRLSTVFEGRLEQLAIMRAIGARQSWLRRELIAEGVLLACAGLLVGIPLGVALAHLLLPIISSTTAIGANVIVSDAIIRISPVSLLVAAGLGIGAVAIAAWVPARRAASVAIVATLRGAPSLSDADAHNRTVGFTRAIVVLAATMTIGHVVSGDLTSGLIASGLLVASAVLLTPAMLRFTASQYAAFLGERSGWIGRYAVSTLVNDPRRSSLTVASVGVGFGSVLWLWTLASSFERSVVDVMPGVLRGDLAISSAFEGAGYVEAPLDDGILESIRAVPGVHAAIGHQTADWSYADGPIALNAFDPEYFADRAFGEWRFLGRTLPGVEAAVARGEAVIVSENFIHNIGGSIGDSIVLDTPEGALSMRVGGVVADFLSPRGTILMSRAVYRERWRNGEITHALVAVDKNASLSRVRGTLTSVLGLRHHIRVRTIGDLVEWFASQARRAFSSLHILGGLVLLVVVVGVGDSVAASTIERTRELGVTRALGARRRVLLRMVMVETAVQALLGVVIATVFGIGLGALWVKATFPALLGWTLSLHVPSDEGLIVIGGALTCALFGAYLPARRASRLDPVAALHAD